ncbi:alkaline phosphatase D family protein [Stenotrophomonas sp. W1S232]|uniref:Alkaline phosphatase D family protein n=1 Tax=Stenotrophomonas koreensis TaxID=266128 RepID=A0A7W3YV78_9GAMM|nr:alkaline phosphatase D family protein [Stenotrophomonas koreensis]MBB1116867.1 alkaline phosphatase D family protein [Stenotrophomonas koreensis]
MSLPSLNRRKPLLGASAMAIFAGLGAPGRLLANPRFTSNPFTLGVASGDPWPDGFVLWTRLAPEPLAEHAGMPMLSVPVRWEVADDPQFRRIVQSGQALARPELGHSVHVEVAGLQPQRPYWYRFHVGSEATSAVGRVRTAPSAGARVDRLRIGVAGCQHYEAGYYTAYAHLSQEPELDAIFHYGDYIYEGAGRPVGPGVVRSHAGGEIYSLDDYRRRYAQYKSDADLQAAHAAAAFLPSWDDHEVDNNWVAAMDQDGVPGEVFLLRRQAAMQAWYENMPVRRAQFPRADGLQMHRRVDFGDLLRVHVLDTRQYRSRQPCDPGLLERGRPCRTPESNGAQEVLGQAQEHWLSEGLRHPARWNLLAQQVMLMPFQYPDNRSAGPLNGDSWSGYPQARQRLIDTLAAHGQGNVVVATGDVHKHHAGVLPSRPEDLLSTPVATEFVTTSISSNGDGDDIPAGWEGVLAANPHAPLLNNRRGYQVFEIGKDHWQTEVVGVDRVSVPGGKRLRIARLVTEHGRPGVQRA